MRNKIWSLQFLLVGVALRMDVMLPFVEGATVFGVAAAGLIACVTFFVEKIYQSSPNLSTQFKVLIIGAAINVAILVLYLVIEYAKFWIGGEVYWWAFWRAMLYMCYLWIVLSSLRCAAAWIDDRLFRTNSRKK